MHRAAVILLLLLASVLMTPSTAQAQSKTRRDAARDVPSAIDVRTVRVRHAEDQVVVRVRFARVVPRRTSLRLDLRRPGSSVRWHVASRPSSRSTYSVIEQVERPGRTSSWCTDQVSATWEQGRRGHARVVVPRSCIPRSVSRLQVRVSSFDKHGSTKGGTDVIDQVSWVTVDHG